MNKLTFFIVVLSIAVSVQAKVAPPLGIICLVPGTLNSLIPGTNQNLNPMGDNYFSREIRNSFENSGFKTVVINGLDPIGEFEENGKRTFKQLSDWYLGRYPKKQVPIILIGHSAGGFYALYAAGINQELPIKSVVTVSTPLKGARLVDLLIGEREPLKFKNRFRGLFQLATKNVEKFLDGLTLDSSITLFSIGGKQPRFPSFKKILKSSFISPFLLPFAIVIKEPSDGLISYRSARGTGVLIRTRDFGLLEFEDLSDELKLRLDHPEQILDYRYFRLLGLKSALYIRDMQRLFYTSLANKLKI